MSKENALQKESSVISYIRPNLENILVVAPRSREEQRELNEGLYHDFFMQLNRAIAINYFAMPEEVCRATYERFQQLAQFRQTMNDQNIESRLVIVSPLTIHTPNDAILTFSQLMDEEGTYVMLVGDMFGGVEQEMASRRTKDSATFFRLANPQNAAQQYKFFLVGPEDGLYRGVGREIALTGIFK